MTDINNILDSLGINIPSSPNIPSQPPVASISEEKEEEDSKEEPQEETQEQEEPVPVPLSDDDFSSILDNIGFSEYNEEETSEDEEEEDEDDYEEEDEEREGEEEEISLPFDTPNPPGDASMETYNFVYTGQGQITEILDGCIHQIQEERIAVEEAAAITATVQQAPEEQNQVEPSRENQIQENSPSLLINDTTSRFSGTEWYEEVKKQSIIFAGIGGIGSNAVFQLSRLSPELIVLYDDDVVDASNLSGQFFNLSQIGMAKVDAAHVNIQEFSTANRIYAVKERFSLEERTSNIMMCGFDNMEARRLYFSAWQAHVNRLEPSERKKCLYLDGRLSIDLLQVFCITGDNTYAMKKYRDEYLFSDEEAETAVCSLKQTTYMACMIGSIMTNLFINFVANQLDPIIPYQLPFFTAYNAQHMIFNVEN